MPSPICLRLLLHFIRLAASRIFWTAGSKRPIRMAMMAMTTRSSMSVNPGRDRTRDAMTHLRGRDGRTKTPPAARASFQVERVELVVPGLDLGPERGLLGGGVPPLELVRAVVRVGPIITCASVGFLDVSGQVT